MAVFFTSDTHFGAFRTLELSRRPFGSVEEMDRCMLDNINAVVSEGDILYHIGDFGDYEKVKEINCDVILVMGNYEHKDCETKFNGDINAFKKYLLDLGFHNIATNYSWFNDMKLVHKPSQHSKHCFTLFGHIHRAVQVKRFGLNVGVDCNFFKPLDLETVMFFRNAIENHYDEEVWI